MKKTAILLSAICAISFCTGCNGIDTSATDSTAETTTSSIELSIPEETTTTPVTEQITDITTETTVVTTEETTIVTEETTSAPQEPQKGPASDDYRQIGDNNILVIGRNNHYQGIMFYGGTYGNCDDYVETVQKYAASLPNVKVYSMVIPTSVDFYNPPEYSGYTELQKDKIEYIEEKLKGTSVTPINVYNTLEKHKDEYIYTRTDHHWFPLGAYYATKEFADKASLTFPELSKYKAVTSTDYVGSMYMYSQDINLYNDPEDYTIYISPNYDNLDTTYYDGYFANPSSGNLFVTPDASAYYCSFLGSDNLVAKVETGVKNGKKLVVVKESYGNALIPFLTSAYEEIYVIDLRYFYLNAVKFCKDVGATDLLFATCAYTPAGGNGSYIEDIRIQ